MLGRRATSNLLSGEVARIQSAAMSPASDKAKGGPEPREVSVVIPTRGRETRLAFALDALGEQTLDADRFEVVVVRDGPGDGPLTTAPEGLSVRFCELESRQGPSLARNAGWTQARSPLIAFTDDDCRPTPDWLERMLEAWAETGRDAGVVIQGRTEPDPDEAHLLHRLARSQVITEPSDWYQCCNLAYPRELLERVGGFDPDFGFGGEDADLGLRAIESGARRVYVDRALVWHAVHPRGVRQAVRDGLSWETIALLLARHPQLRDVFRHRLFWKDAHERLLLAAVGVALAPRTRGASLLATLPYLEWHWDRTVRPTPRRLAGFAAVLPERVLADAAELAGTARSAIKYRTPLL
jgi:glycosyltransferase involved in cell wall biosynthesis